MRVTPLVVLALLPAASCFVVPGISPLQVSSEDRVVSRPVLSRPGHRFSPWSRTAGIPLFASSNSAGTSKDGNTADQEVENIQNARMTARQIKAELDFLGVSYKGLLEKGEFVRALAEARVAGSGAPPVSEDASADFRSEQGASAAAAEEPRVSEAPGVSEAPRSSEVSDEPTPGNVGDGDVPTVDEQSTDTIHEEGGDNTSDDDGTADTGIYSETTSTSEDSGAEVEPTEEGSDGGATTSTSESPLEESVPEQKGASGEHDEDASVGAAEPPQAEEPVTQEGDPAPSTIPDMDPTTDPASSPPASGTGDSDPSAPPPDASQDEPSTSDDTASSDAIDEEIARITEARMTAKQIKAELDSLGVSYRGLLEKSEFVRRLAEARTDPSQRGAGEGDAGNVGVEQDGGAANEAAADSSSRDGEPAEASQEPSASAEEPPPVPEQPPASAEGASERAAGGDEGTAGANTGERDEVMSMRISQIKKELDERGVSYRGLLEKSEFVDLLVDARARGVTAPPSNGDVGASGSNDSGARNDEPKTGGYDPSYKDVEVKKMNKETGSQGEQPGGASGPGGAAGGFDIGSILSGLGGMAGAAGAGGPGGTGGFDIGSILSGLGGMGGAAGGNPGAGAPGAGGMGDMLGKIMNDPRAMAAFQKAQQNPRVMEAIQDISRNGLGAAAKYRDDPEVSSVIEELKSLF